MSADILHLLQRRIEELHGTEIELDVRSYVVAPDVWREIPGAREGLPEQLFVREDGEDMELALYIAPEIVSRLSADDPHRRLHDGNLENFCIATEGVSHFVLVAARATEGRPVTALELEIQAEVDKFVAAWRLLLEQGSSGEPAARALLRQLFEGYELRDALPPEEAERYHVATRVAQRFCGTLAERFGREGDVGGALREVRRFVHRELAEKLRAA